MWVKCRGDKMGMLRDMMIEERERLLNVIKVYKGKMKDLPKGSIVKKRINNIDYAYMNYRENGKHISKYIGPFNSNKVSSLIKQINEHKKYKKLLKQTNDNLKDVQRYFRGER
jgi:hypothetical protein